jgi:hypothetical protein
VKTLVLGGFLLCACNDALPIPPDLEINDFSLSDLSFSAPDLSLSDLAGCDLSHTRAIPGNGPIREGTICDDLYFCVAHGGVAQAIVGIAPVFKCMPALGPNNAGCSGMQWYCEWDPGPTGTEPGVIDAADLAQICKVTAYPTPPELITCIVYL